MFCLGFFIPPWDTVKKLLKILYPSSPVCFPQSSYLMNCFLQSLFTVEMQIFQVFYQMDRSGIPMPMYRIKWFCFSLSSGRSNKAVLCTYVDFFVNYNLFCEFLQWKMVPLVQCKKWKKENMKKTNYNWRMQFVFRIAVYNSVYIYFLINFTGLESYKRNHSIIIQYNMWPKLEST